VRLLFFFLREDDEEVGLSTGGDTDCVREPSNGLRGVRGGGDKSRFRMMVGGQFQWVAATTTATCCESVTDLSGVLSSSPVTKESEW